MFSKLDFDDINDDGEPKSLAERIGGSPTATGIRADESDFALSLFLCYWYLISCINIGCFRCERKG